MHTLCIYVFIAIFLIKPIISLSIIRFVFLRDTETDINFMLQVDITLMYNAQPYKS